MARPKDTNQFDEKVIQVSRVSKKTKGGNTIGFSVVMVVGDKKGQVGVAKGKAPDVVSAIRKGVKKAKKKMIAIPIDGTTIPFKVETKKGAAHLLLKPAPRGTGVIAGGPVRAVVEAAGIRDISAKILGTNNQASNAYATFKALREIASLVKIKGIKLRSVAEVEAEEQEKLRLEQEKAQSKVKTTRPTAQKTAQKTARKASRKTAQKKTTSRGSKKAAQQKSTPKSTPKSTKAKTKTKAKPKSKTK